MAAMDFPGPPLTVGQLYPATPVAGIPQYKWDGTAWVAVIAAEVQNFVRRTGDTMTGALTLSGAALNVANAPLTMTGAAAIVTLAADPAADMEAATRRYVDSGVGGVGGGLTSKVAKAGGAEGVMTGLLTLSADPTTAMHAATKQYVDAHSGSASAPQGRLTLAAGTPVMTTTQISKTTIFYSPYVGSSLPLYNGTAMTMTVFTELSASTTDTTKSPAAIGATKNNDWFVWNDAGTIRLSHGPDWTSDTVRSAGTALTRVNGIWLNNAAITNGPAASRGTYVGTTRSDAASQLGWVLNVIIPTSGQTGFLGVWNAYNRVAVKTVISDVTDSWVYSTSAWRAANGSAGMRYNYITGLEEDGFTAMYNSNVQGGASGIGTGIGYDNTTAFSGSPSVSGGSFLLPATSRFSTTSLGFHFFSAIENAFGSAGTFYGDNTGFFQSGLYFEGHM